MTPEQLAQVCTNMGTVSGYRQALEGCAANLRAQANSQRETARRAEAVAVALEHVAAECEAQAQKRQAEEALSQSLAQRALAALAALATPPAPPEPDPLP